MFQLHPVLAEHPSTLTPKFNNNQQQQQQQQQQPQQHQQQQQQQQQQEQLQPQLQPTSSQWLPTSPGDFQPTKMGGFMASSFTNDSGWDRTFCSKNWS